MTNKEIRFIATNWEAQCLLRKIDREVSNLCHKTIYEQKTSEKKIKRWTKELKDLVNDYKAGNYSESEFQEWKNDKVLTVMGFCD